MPVASISQGGEALHHLVSDGPEAYRTQMPLERWCLKLREQAIPTQISYHAGTHLCKTHHVYVAPLGCAVGASDSCGLHSSAFDAGKSCREIQSIMPCLPVQSMATALSLILDDLTAAEVA